MRDLRTLPKTDLHLHFQGAVRPATLRDLAAAHGVALPRGLDGERYVWNDFLDFIDQYGTVCSAFRCPADFRRVATEICEDLVGQGVRYAEVTLTVRGYAVVHDDWSGAVSAALDGFDEGFERFGVRCNLVLDHVRGSEVEHAERLLEVARAYRERGVVAIGLGGSEMRSGADAADVFRRAKDEGLHSVPHAGEAMGVDSIREAIDLLGAERLGHGFRVLEDDDLTTEIRERGIVLEVCPTSNVATRVVESLDVHPLPRLMAAGLHVTLNSDDPAMFASPVLGEYEVGRRVFGLPDQTLAALARAGVAASYAPDDLTDEMFRGIDAWMDATV
jgi:adenosine deaminase